MNAHNRVFLGRLLVAVFCTIGLLFLSPAHGQVVGERARLSHLTLFDGSRFDPDSVKGKVTLLYFWASWCPYCRKEMPVIQKHYLAYRERAFNVLAINFRDKEDNARKMLQEVAPIDFFVGKITDEYRSDYPKVHGTPTWFLIDRSGIIRKVVVGQSVISGGIFDGLKDDLEAALAATSQ